MVIVRSTVRRRGEGLHVVGVVVRVVGVQGLELVTKGLGGGDFYHARRGVRDVVHHGARHHAGHGMNGYRAQVKVAATVEG